MKYFIHIILALIIFNHCIAKEAFAKQSKWMQFNKQSKMSVDELICNKKLLNLTDDDELKLLTKKVDQLGFSHNLYQQLHRSIPVENATYMLHEKSKTIYKANGNLAINININGSTIPSLTESAALKKALTFIDADQYAWENEYFEATYKQLKKDELASFYPKGELVWLSNNEYKLTYKFEVYAVKPHSRKLIYIDASNGEILKSIEKLHSCTLSHATGTTNYSGEVSFMACENAGSYILKNGDVQVFDSSNSYATALNPILDIDGYFNSDKAATEVYWATNKAKEYFLNTFNRNSLDDEGIPLLSWVHYTNRFSEGANAYWNGSWMLYGDGDNSSYTSFTSPDIVAHEMTHGITDFSANLSYTGESGALNESFSDIFGIAFKAHCQTENNWIIGSDIVIQPGKNGMRNLSNPNDEAMMQMQPNTYKGNNWIDEGAAHINSGVQNFWFYLLSVGGQGVNDNGDTYEVEGIGMDKAIQVAYRNLNYYLTANAQYADARNGAIEAAKDLYGENSFEAEQVAAAWCAVGVGVECVTILNSPSCSHKDSLALVAVYNKLNTDNWSNRWDLNQPMDKWDGVFLNENRCVVKLEIDGRGLSGSIADEIGNLTSLVYLDLSENLLIGNIPSSIGNLENLLGLALHYNNLSGDIPNSLTKLNKLESLYLGNNKLTGVLPSKFSYSLKNLLLNDNELTGVIPSSLLTYDLEDIDLSNNNLTGLIPDFGNNNLKGIYLSHNQLSGYIPTSYSENSKLERIEINDNLLEGTLPAELGSLQNLGVVWLQNNLLEGCFHPNLKSLCENSAPTIDIGNNNFDAVWEDFCDSNSGICANINPCRAQDSISLLALYNSIENLKWDINKPINTWRNVELNIDGCVEGLYLSDEGYGGIIPPEIGNFSELQNLRLSENYIKGEIPKEIGKLTKLRQLNLDENKLSGEIPKEIGNLKNLQQLNLSDNNLDGLIPIEISTLTNLQYLFLSYNNLYGDLSFIENLTNLTRLGLSNNNISGTIPQQVNSFSNLVDMRLDNNSITGFLPDDFLKDIDIDYMDISNNYLQGCYPGSMEKFCDYNFKISEGNNFTVSFENFCYEDNFEDNWPCEILPGCRWSDSLTLITVHESLKGTNGYDFWNTNQPINTWRGVELNEHGCVKSIEMFEETFDGPLPAAIGNLSNLEALILWDCYVVGSIPPEIGNLHSLKELDLSWNELNGRIPREIGQLINLKRLELEDNDLTGSIPKSLASLKQLEYIDLGSNNFEGTLPPILSTLTNLQQLDVTGNQLNGCYHPLLQSLCSQLGPLAFITEGNIFVEDWVDFCDVGVGKCITPPCQMADSLSLVSLYLKTDGPNWAERYQWNFNKPMKYWNGVELNYAGCVKKLDLLGAGLKNVIPQDVTNLIFLEELNLGLNELNGGVPSALANLSYLKTINLSYNNLSGYIPPQLPDLFALQNLDLSSNQLSGGIPGQFVNMPYLEEFKVNNNLLSECYPGELILWCHIPQFNDWQISNGNNFPASWSAFCENLEGSCQPGSNKPCRVVDSLSLLAINNSMPVLDWDTSKPIDTWPGISLNDYGCVYSIYLDNAAFGTIPPQIGNFSELAILTIKNNPDILGEIPGEIGNLSNLKELNISNTGIGGEIPSSLGLLDLRVLFLNDNSLTGPFPDFFANFERLGMLSLRNNQLSGCYADELNFLCDPDRLGLFNNNHEISDGNNFDANWEDFCNAGLGSCSTNLSCRAIDSLSLLALNSSMPVFDWDTSKPINTWPGITLNESGCVKRIVLDNAAFGTIPPEIGNFNELEILTISNSPDILGGIPEEIGNLSNLKELNISNTGVSGEIPSSLGLLGLDLTLLFLNDNNLTGPVPWFLTNLLNLSALSLKNNQLSGCYEDELSSFCYSATLGPYSSNAEISDGNNFDISWEDFCNTGFGNCSNNFSCRANDSISLIALNNSMPVFDWDTSKPIDTWPGVTLNQAGCVSSIILDNAAFGSIPLEIGNFSELEILTITNNPDILGDIPNTIGNLVNLKELNISHNSISGEIPSSLGLLNLDVLFLNDNNLTGSMPSFLTNFQNLYILSLRNNQLSGCYGDELSFFCDSIRLGPSNSNYEISDGNNFDADWEDFCQAGLGSCSPTLSCSVTDSLALLALHNSIYGFDWNLSNAIDTWQGVSLNENGCVNKLILAEGLVGNLPEALGNFSSLQELVIKDNGIFGSIPLGISNLNTLNIIEIQNTALMPDFPSTVKNLSNLDVLHYENNMRGEPLPLSVFGIDNLETLYLANNDFTGSIPSQLSNLNKLSQLYLNDNRLTGIIPASLANLNSLFVLSLRNNNLSGCFDEALLAFCDPSILGPYGTNYEISDGNLFDTTWEDFCDNGTEACMATEVWPGDFNNNGIVDKDDFLYYGLAEGSTGATRENTSPAWFGQQAINWQNSVNGINGKHQDADGNGIVNQFDIQPIIDNYGKSTTYQLNSLIESPVKLFLEPVKEIVGNDEITLVYEIYARSSLGTFANLHGISGSIDFSKLPVKSVEVDFTNSSLSSNRHMSNFNEENGILDIAITKTDKANEVATGSLARVVVIIDDLPTGDLYRVAVNGGSIMSANGILNTIGGSTIHGFVPTNFGLVSDLAISVIVTNEQCNSLGSARVCPVNGIGPFKYSWSTGAYTEQINNLYSDDYSVTVTDANNSTITISFQINGTIPVYDENGVRACESGCPYYLTTYPTINSGAYKAAKTLHTNGAIKGSKEVELKAGESIILEQGFQIEKGAELLIDIENCK